MTKAVLFINAHFPEMYRLRGESLLVKDGLIDFIGDNETALLRAKEDDFDLIDLAGKTLMPGFCDFHLHLAYTAEKIAAVDCETDSLEECLNRVAERAKITPAGDWIIGYNWNQNRWQPPEYGTAEQLDAISQQHPILLHAKSLHAAWINSTAMRIAGISNDSPDPDGGLILRDAQGEPTGILLENAIALVTSKLPEVTVEQHAQNILKTQAYFHSLGLTAVHDFDAFPSAEALLILAERGELKLRVSKNLPLTALDRVIAEDWRKKLDKPPFLTPGWLKAFADGALGPQSAAILEPYEASRNRGMLLVEAEDLAAKGMLADRHNWPLSVHAIGDWAVREVIDAFAIIRKQQSPLRVKQSPLRIEHVQLIQPSDLQRMRDLELIASVQPIHAPSDMVVADRLWGERTKFAYAYQSLFEQGIETRFGSDSPVESPNPFLGLHAAVTRQNLDGDPSPEGWHPEQRVSIENAIAAYTQPLPDFGGEHPLQPGLPADFIVLEEDLFKLHPSQLPTVKPLTTIVGGEIVFER